MFKGNSHTYQIHFERQVENFINQYSQVPLAKAKSSIAIGVSAGADSVALLRFCIACREKHPQLDFTVLHFNHQSRPEENAQEESFVKNLCQEFNLSLRIGHMAQKGQTELAWRVARQQFFSDCIKKIDAQTQLWLAHHIDDSWEWSLMQQTKSGHVQGQLGIPVRHAFIFRPFLSVSKKQILSYLKSLEQSYLEDSSNLNIKHERNWWRRTVLKKIQQKYPQVLKHYVQRQMELALELKLIYRQTAVAQRKILDAQTHHFFLEKDQKIEHSQHLIKKSLHELCQLDRMKIRKQLKSLFQSYQNRKKGPIYFSGGVKAYLGKSSFVLTNKDNFNSDILNEQ